MQFTKLASDLLPKKTEQQIAGAAGSIFHACSSIGKIVQTLLTELEIDEAISLCDVLRTELLLATSDEAKPTT